MTWSCLSVKKLTLDKLIEEYMSYPIVNDVRFGQYMFNKYYSELDSWPELFYETNADTVYLMLCRKIHEDEK